VVTGLGAVTPLGNTVDELWSGLRHGRSGIGPVTKFNASAYPTRIAGEVRGFDPLKFFDRKEARRLDPYLQYAVAAAAMAMDDARLEPGAVDPARLGTAIGSSIGGLRTLLQAHATLLAKGPERVSPFFVPMMIINMAAGVVAMRFGAGGPSVAPATACATGNQAIGEALSAIQSDRADVMIAGGADATVIDLGFAGFCAERALSIRNDEPERASRPFDANRDGFVCSEGAGVVVLEALSHARARGVRIHGEVLGYGSSNDAHHMTAPHPEGLGAGRAMHAALRHAGVLPEDVQYVNAHGTSTPQNDRCETIAIKQVFGSHANRLAVSSTKSMTGHLLGAAGGVEAIATVLALRDGIIPPTINYDTPDPECDLDYVANVARNRTIDLAISNGFGFGGVNATLVFRRFAGA
jgi:3-oxoacyl-[acyl-carrier-protein] synthase II